MRGAAFFEIPEVKGNREVMIELVEAVPDAWKRVLGGLDAPEEHIASGAAVRDTGFLLQEFHSIQPTIVGRWQGEGRGRRGKPDLYAIIGEQKLPGFIDVENAGKEPITVKLVKEIVIAYLYRGYRGALHFYSRVMEDSRHPYPETCRIHFQRWQGQLYIGGPRSEYPPLVELEWATEAGGKQENLEPILAVCRQLGLRDIAPMVG